MSKILVTGAAGFIGSNTVNQLLAEGYEVVGIDNMNAYYDPRLKRNRLKAFENEQGYTHVEGDISDMKTLEALFEAHRFSAVVNLAARAGVRYSMVNPHIYLQTNTQGTLNLLELMRKHSIQKFVLASTSSLYAGQAMPYEESLPVNEPISPYAATKKAAEAMAYTYHYLYEIDVSIVRYFTVYGPAGRPDMSIFRFIKWIQENQPISIYGDGEQARDFTYVEDIAEGTVSALRNVGYEVINLGGGRKPISLNTILEKLSQMLETKPDIQYNSAHPADMRETWANIDKAERLLNWQPRTSLDEGLHKTVEWHRNHAEFVQSLSV